MAIHHVHVSHGQIWDWNEARTVASIWLSPRGSSANAARPFLVNLNHNAGFPHPSHVYAQNNERPVGLTGAKTPFAVIVLFFPSPVPASASAMSFFVEQEGAEGFDVAGPFG